MLNLSPSVSKAKLLRKTTCSRNQVGFNNCNRVITQYLPEQKCFDVYKCISLQTGGQLQSGCSNAGQAKQKSVKHNFVWTLSTFCSHFINRKIKIIIHIWMNNDTIRLPSRSGHKILRIDTTFFRVRFSSFLWWIYYKT